MPGLLPAELSIAALVLGEGVAVFLSSALFPQATKRKEDRMIRLKVER
jgi:hypothetical protein